MDLCVDRPFGSVQADGKRRRLVHLQTRLLLDNTYSHAQLCVTKRPDVSSRRPSTTITDQSITTDNTYLQAANRAKEEGCAAQEAVISERTKASLDSGTEHVCKCKFMWITVDQHEEKDSFD